MKEKFLKTYANLPMGVRTEVIAVLDGEPMSWRVCRREILADTRLGKRILKYLIELKLI